jgi:nicotinamide-nucleotide amidase
MSRSLPSQSTAAACWIVTIGDELINGTRVDTNTAWLAGKLAVAGIRVVRAVSIGDNAVAIRRALDEGIEEADVLIVSGGLGPTQDDRTKEVLADYFDVGLHRARDVENAVREFFEQRGRAVTDVNLDQALVPEGFEWQVNPRGTAPGLLRRENGKLLFVLPGVPGEMKALYEEWVGPILEDQFGGRWSVQRRWFRTTGIGESDLFGRLGGLEDLAPVIDIAYLPSAYGVAVYLTGQGPEPDSVAEALDEASRRVIEGAGTFLYATSDQNLTDHLAGLLTERGQTLSLAESCTGGQISHLLTNVPGASEWLMQGWVTYSNESKEVELGVPHELLEKHGAVSEEVAKAMGEGARATAGTDYALAVTGIAGPGGGTPEKPVGLTYVACAGPDQTVVRRYLLGTTGRRYIKQRTVANALDLLRRMLTGLDPYEGGWETPE